MLHLVDGAYPGARWRRSAGPLAARGAASTRPRSRSARDERYSCARASWRSAGWRSCVWFALVIVATAIPALVLEPCTP